MRASTPVRTAFYAYNARMREEDGAVAAYAGLGPDEILNAVEAAGLRCDGHIAALNSYENRVYQIGVEDGAPIVAKFYRPGRWSDAAILEEHAFTLELAEQEIPVIAPLAVAGETLFHAGAHRLALYPRIGGRPPEPDNPEHLLMLGRCIARLHNVGALRPFAHRPVIDIQTFGIEPSRFLVESEFIPADLRDAYLALAGHVIARLEASFAEAGEVSTLRLHGDCHLGNILMRDGAPFLVDFDDARTGPAIQDLWMLLSGDRRYMTARLDEVLEGYVEFREFDPRELRLIEPLRTLRLMHYAGWLARRWEDPAFPRNFPWFNTQRYWEDHILALKEQLSLLDEPPLDWEKP
ncbi:MAG TPA: serine/threonine protein kinase [Gammaproteobacteria bacterium]|jgi:Ser/Thr protein kinase RdoA (MazF antagonist)